MLMSNKVNYHSFNLIHIHLIVILHISNLNTILTLLILVSECQCDVRGTQLNVNYGDWCYIKDSPCKSLTGEVMSGTWVRCHDQGDPTAQELIKCPIMAHSGETSLDYL